MIVLSGPTDIVWAVTRVGDAAVAALADAGVYVWEPGQTDNPVLLPVGNEGRVHSDLQASPDGGWLASHGNGHLWCWRRTAGGWDLAFHEPDRNTCAIAFSSDGELESLGLTDRPGGGVDVQLVRHKLGTRKAEREIVSTFPAPDGLRTAGGLARLHYYCVDYSPRGGVFLLSPTDRYQHLWSTRGPRPIGSIKMRSVCNEGVLSPDGTVAAIDGGTTVYLYRVDTQEPLGTWKVRHCYSPKLAWSPDGRRLLRADASTAVRQYDLASGAEVGALGLKRHRATAVRYSPDGLTYLVGTFRGPVVVWDVE
ncbi:MAG: WD40 repeat domain-containing protein [Gemmataceae bacterium]